MTATYWEIGRRIVDDEQGSEDRAAYGERLIGRLSLDLQSRYGRGFGVANVRQMRKFYLEWPRGQIRQTVSGETEQVVAQAASTGSPPESQARPFPLPWSHYVRLMAVSDRDARAFYEAEALRGGWSVRQLGGDFAFLGRQRRLRIGDEWYRIDLLFFHRCLRCLVIIDLKVGKFTHADLAAQFVERDARWLP